MLMISATPIVSVDNYCVYFTQALSSGKGNKIKNFLPCMMAGKKLIFQSFISWVKLSH